jgi:hypothetical protein
VWLTFAEAEAAVPTVAPGGSLDLPAFRAWLATQTHCLGAGWGLRPGFAAGPNVALRPLLRGRVALRKLLAFGDKLGEGVASMTAATRRAGGASPFEPAAAATSASRSCVCLQLGADVQHAGSAGFAAELTVESCSSTGGSHGKIASGGAAHRQAAAEATGEAAGVLAGASTTVITVECSLEDHVSAEEAGRLAGNLRALLQAAGEYAELCLCGAPSPSPAVRISTAPSTTPPSPSRSPTTISCALSSSTCSSAA